MYKFLNECAEAMNAYRQLTGDNSYGSRVRRGQLQLVRVTYDASGASSVESCSDWIASDKWLDFMASISL